jgi:UDP-GlcNAc3NAcA epimerase
MKIFTLVGARPQFIKAVPVSRALFDRGIQEVLVHTGQHHDAEMSDVFFDELNLRSPDYNLGIAGGTHGQMTGRMLAGIEELIISEVPDAVLVYGDTNSTLAASLAASKLHVPVVHIEAGLRSWNKAMPEEVNRVLTDHVSELLLCPSAQAVHNLRCEGIEAGVYEVGDVMADVCRVVIESVCDASELLNRFGVEAGAYCLVTCHRAENTDSRERLSSILSALGEVPCPVLFPLHPRTRAAIESYKLSLPSNFITTLPLGYADMIGLLLNARLLFTDSGGLQKEAYWAKTRCVTLREETEWIETVQSGWNCLAGADRQSIFAAFEQSKEAKDYSPLYGDGKAAQKCVELIWNHFQ